MSRTVAEFMQDFVCPLLGGGAVKVSRPVRPRDFYAMVGELNVISGSPVDVRFLRLQRAQLLVAEPLLPDVDIDEFGLWVGLHNTLALDHPDRESAWARAVKWRNVETVSRTLLTLGQPHDFFEALVRHVAVGPFIDLRREDHIISTVDGEERYAGQPLPRRRLRFSSLQQLGAREEIIEWLADRHMPEVERLIQDALWASPITCLMRPLAAPPGWSALIAAPFLKQRGFARAVANTWAGTSRWIEIGGAVMASMMEPLFGASSAGARGGDAARRGRDTTDDGDGPRALPVAGAIAALPGSSYGAGPREIGAIVGTLIHVHFLKVLELGARLGVAATRRDKPVQMFLALPLLLPRLKAALGEPLPGLDTALGFDGQVARRWTEYLDHLGELIPQPIVENLVATLVPRIVKASSA